MNPYSFKRFLENPGRPRRPIQLVCAGSNRIMVQGDLPDCVRNGDTGIVSTADVSLPQDQHDSIHHQAHRPNLLQTTPMSAVLVHRHQGPEESHSVDAVNTDNSCIPHNPTCSRLPDIHLCTTTEHRSNPNLGDGANISPSRDSCSPRMQHPAPSGLPDFLPNAFIESEAHVSSRAWEQSAQPPLARSIHTLSLQSTSLPTLLLGLGENRLVSDVGLTTATTTASTTVQSTSKSHEHLSSRSGSQLGNKFDHSSAADCVSRLNGLGSEQLPRIGDSVSGHDWSAHTTPSHSSQADPFVDAHPISLSGSIASPDPRFLNQQERLEALTVRLDETEQELREARRLLREQTQLLYNARAESEVARREAEVRVKALEHELATEKLRSAKDRLLAVQLRGQLASIRQTMAQTPTDLSPQSPGAYSAGSSERVCSPRTTSLCSQTTISLAERPVDVGCPGARLTGTGSISSTNYQSAASEFPPPPNEWQ